MRTKLAYLPAFYSVSGFGSIVSGSGGRPGEPLAPGGPLPDGPSLRARILVAFIAIRRRISPPAPDRDAARERAYVAGFAEKASRAGEEVILEA